MTANSAAPRRIREQRYCLRGCCDPVFEERLKITRYVRSVKIVSTQLGNPPLQALRSSQQRFAISYGQACKYPADVTPFAAIEDDSTDALRDLFSIMNAGETTYVISNRLPVMPEGLSCGGALVVKQMIYPHDRELPAAEAAYIRIEPLSCANAAEMVDLTQVAFPGFFRLRTCEMGNYYGIRHDGRLIAMCGERMNFGLYRELSGLCTHPDFRGQGHAVALMIRLLGDHRRDGQRSYLHVSARNINAIAMYEHIGFEHCGEYAMYPLTCEAGRTSVDPGATSQTVELRLPS